MSKTLATYWRFLLAGLLKQAQTGAIVPSQRFLVNQMLVPIPANFRGRIFELGAGTGALTFRLADKCPKASILACEINPVLAHDLEYRLAAVGLGRRVRVYSGPAEQLLAEHASKGEPPQFILSGIPLGNLDREKVLALINCVREALAPGGIYIQFQHSLIDRKKIKTQFSRLRTVPVFLNFPPAVVYYALK
jgi:phospholipid N-methyltransferase